MMAFHEFHNGLRILLGIDKHELVDARILKPNDANGWGEFRRDPFRWLIRASDKDAAALWAIVERRQRGA